MFEAISKESSRRLWAHQVDALNFAIHHLNTLEAPCLIRMPTGTGKTGVIACLSRLSNQNSTLILTPWANLRDQMIVDLESNFWRTVGLVPKVIEIVPMLPTTAESILNSAGKKVIVATFATLNDLRRDDVNTYSRLADSISLVIVDEGHYEPAVEWGRSVKDLNTKTVLLTATPYRNDLKLFRIKDPEQSTHHFTHQEATQKGIIRDLRFEEIGSQADIHGLSSAFIEKWKELKKNGSLPSRDPRAIICCSNASDIETVVKHLKSAGLQVIGVHEQFENSSEENLVKDVPGPRSSPWEVWVHQNKLTEGLDDSRFCCVALFTRVRNDRKLIQQIGRVLRRHPKDRKKEAVLLAPSQFSAALEWNAYLEFETDLELLNPMHFREVVNKLLDSQPKVEYFDRRFRRRFIPSELSERSQVIIPPSVLVREAGNDFSLDQYVEYCTDTLNLQDAVILGQDLNAPCQKSLNYALWVYASIRNSRYLQNTSLYEIKLETHCVVVAGGFVFVSDSRGNYPVEYIEDHTLGVSASQLSRFLDKNFRPTNVSINSSIPYDTVFRGASLHGHDLLNIATSLTDRVQICRSARGSSKVSGRRYIGMMNGRLRRELSEEALRSFDLSCFVSWVENVSEILNSNVSASALFNRYMPTCPPPSVVQPRTMSIDLLRLNLSLKLTDGRECRLENSSCEISMKKSENTTRYLCSFGLEGEKIKNEFVSLRLEYQTTKQRFWFYKDGGASVRVSDDDNDEIPVKSLAEFLNQNQDVILIGLEGGEIVYQGRNFYKVDYSFAEHSLLDLIERPTNAPKCNTEKGTKDQVIALKTRKSTKFPKGSLFKTIAERQINLPFQDEVLICADLGTECADFIAANFDKQQLALVHAKSGKNQKISASSFHDVVSQAMKNLVYLTRTNDIPAGIKSWSSKTKWNGTGIPRLYRKPDHAQTGLQLWSRIKSEIIGSSNPELYVILLTTGCCNLDELRLASREPDKRTPEIAQLLHLLDGLSGYARQLGIRVKIYDIPYATN
jgi:superfamily II DNA or RNA helicase